MLFSLLKHHLDLTITDTALKVSRSLYCFTTSLYLMVLKTISPGCGVRASLILFLVPFEMFLIGNFSSGFFFYFMILFTFFLGPYFSLFLYKAFTKCVFYIVIIVVQFPL